MSRHCILVDKEIAYGHCVDICAEIAGLKIEDELKGIKKRLKNSTDDLHKKCSKCPNLPFLKEEWE